MHRKKIPALLLLENGTSFPGYSFGAELDSFGEVCFNTSMTGYQEILTDPSYSGQMVTLTYPMIGNYGIHPDYDQSSKVHATGLIVKEYVDRPSNFISRMSLQEYLKNSGTAAIERIDTRKLVLTIRREGAMRGGIFTGKTAVTDEMIQRVRKEPVMVGQDLASRVSTDREYLSGQQTDKKYRIAVLDYGVKRAILQNLERVGFAVQVFPASTTYETLKAGKFDAYFLSNGPGDPEPLGYAIETAKKLMEDGAPIFGICLGHQLLGLASGRKTYKLKFGHRGGNQPVKDLETGRVDITAQNHGFAVEMDSAKSEFTMNRINLNDKTVEGFVAPGRSLMSVQYHPEASPGPNDALHLFEDFYRMVDAHKARSSQ